MAETLSTGFDAARMRHAVAPLPSPYLSREALCGASVRTRVSLPFSAEGACLQCQRAARPERESGRGSGEASDG